MIRDLPHGETVKEPGAYRTPMSWYHTQGICPGPSISSSGLRRIAMESPWHFWMSSDLNPNRYPAKEDSDALILGKATHALVLGDENFDREFVYVPKDAPRKPTPQQIKAYDEGRATDIGIESVEFWRAFDDEAEGRLMLTDVQIEKIARMSENIKQSPEAVAALTGGMTEISMIWQDEITGVWVKSRPDVLPDNGFDAADLKTFAPRVTDLKRAVQQAVTQNAYHMQMALAAMGAEAVFGMTTKEFILIFAQSTEPHCVIPVRLDEESLYIGTFLCRKAINTFADCLAREEWPGPVTGILDYTIPPSLLEKYYEEIGNEAP